MSGRGGDQVTTREGQVQRPWGRSESQESSEGEMVGQASSGCCTENRLQGALVAAGDQRGGTAVVQASRTESEVVQRQVRFEGGTDRWIMLGV